MRRRAWLPLAGLALATALARPAQAAPRWNTGLETGICGATNALSFRGLGWCNALRADVLFLRERSTDFGLGPSLRLGTARFDDARLDAGLSLLVPIFDSLPLVLEAGPHLRNFHEPGIYGSAFFGLRGFNHYGSYDVAGGLQVTAERSFVTGTPSALWITARIDGAWIAMPFIFVFNGLK